MEALIKFVQDEFVTTKDFPEFAAGDTISIAREDTSQVHGTSMSIVLQYNTQPGT